MYKNERDPGQSLIIGCLVVLAFVLGAGFIFGIEIYKGIFF